VWGKDKKVTAILCADIHLSLNPPVWRSAEPDWFAAMRRPLMEIAILQNRFNCPVICAGDIFDRWNSPPELINFAFNNLPNMYAIPGQHDLPLHKYEDIERSAYWTLVQAEKIENIHPEYHVKNGRMILHGFPFGFPITHLAKKWNRFDNNEFVHIAVVHEYLWIRGRSYPNASLQNYYGSKQKNSGYDLIVYGDNHKGFSIGSKKGEIKLLNCGTLMRRKSDEIDYKPQIGLLFEDGSIKPYYLDTSKDKYLDIQSKISEEDSLDMKAFIKELEKLGDSDLDFHTAVKQYLKKNKIKMEICNIIYKAMGL